MADTSRHSEHCNAAVNMDQVTPTQKEKLNILIQQDLIDKFKEDKSMNYE